MKDPLKTAQRLVALASAAATPEMEARNAAMAACRMIQEHNLLVRTPSALEGVFGDWFASGGFRAPTPQPEPPPPPPVKPVAPPPVKKKRLSAQDISLSPGMDAACSFCGHPIVLVATTFAGRIWHRACYEKVKDQI